MAVKLIFPNNKIIIIFTFQIQGGYKALKVIFYVTYTSIKILIYFVLYCTIAIKHLYEFIHRRFHSAIFKIDFDEIIIFYYYGIINFENLNIYTLYTLLYVL